MNEQLTLAPVHRQDPAESVYAARKVDARRQLEQVIRCLYEASEALTDDAIAERCGLLRHSAGTRRGVAVRMGYVVRAGRGVSALGNPAATWILTAEGKRAAASLTEGDVK